MSMTSNSTTSERPAKPYDEFPLYAHCSGRWAQENLRPDSLLRAVGDWQGALSRYLAQKDDLEAGRRPKAEPQANAESGLIVQEMVGGFSTHASWTWKAGPWTSKRGKNTNATANA